MISRPTPLRARALLPLLVGSLLTGCGGGASSSAPAGPPSPTPTASAGWASKVGAVASPLTVTGTSSVTLDVAALQKLPRAHLVVNEPFTKKRMAFDGVWLIDVLNKAGIPAGATKVKAHAVDDYQVDLAVADLAKGQVLLADTADGAAIALDKGGPVRIVFADGSARGRNEDLWIWSLDQLTLLP